MKWYIWALIGIGAIGLLAKIAWKTPVELTVPDDDDVDALSRMIASENGNDIEIIQRAVAWTAVNEAERRGISVAMLVMPTGIPGAQGTSGHGYASTARPATDATRSLAFDVLSGKNTDPTDGAVQFDAPRTQRALHTRDPVKYKTPEQVAEIRMKEGKEMVTLPDVNPDYMRWWRYA